MTARTLELPQALKRRLLHLRQLTGTTTAPSLASARVVEAEEELGVDLGDPVLALLANRDDALVAHEIRLRNVVTHTKELHEAGGPREMVGIGRDPEGDFVIGTPLGGGLLCILDLETGDAREIATDEWLDELIAMEIEKLRDVESEEKARVFKVLGDAEVTAFAPAIVVDETPKRRVEHAKFGVGEVIHELGGGTKLEIRFGDGSTRTLLARFVKPVGDGSTAESTAAEPTSD